MIAIPAPSSVGFLLLAVAASGAVMPQAHRQGDSRQESKLFAALRQVSQPGAHQEPKFLEMQESLRDSFNALPKNSHGRLAPRAVRHLLHTFFAKTNGWLLKGLEHHGFGRTSVRALHEVNIIQHKTPTLRRALLEARLLERGLSLPETAALAVALKHLVLDEAIQVLDSAYQLYNRSTRDSLTANQSKQVLRAYVAMYGEGVSRVDSQSLLNKAKRSKRDWVNIILFVEDTIQARVDKKKVNGFVKPRFSFQEIWDITEDISEKYGSFQNQDCVDMKSVLVGLDPENSGRVPLKAFYKRHKDAKYWFEESADYLRKTGCLDESVPEDPRVLVANYVAGPENCVATFRYSAVCCLQECGLLMGEIESKLQAPRASPQQVLDVVGNLSSGTVEAPRELPEDLAAKLDNIAAMHDGEIPLHGRLFAQWIHYAFPNECPYPHVITSASALSFSTMPNPSLMATKWEKRRVRLAANATENCSFLGLWTDEEVLPLEDLRTEAISDSPRMSFLWQTVLYGLLALGGLRGAWMLKVQAPCPCRRAALVDEVKRAKRQPHEVREGKGKHAQKTKKGKEAAQSQKAAKNKDIAAEDCRSKQKAAPAKEVANVELRQTQKVDQIKASNGTKSNVVKVIATEGKVEQILVSAADKMRSDSEGLVSSNGQPESEPGSPSCPSPSSPRSDDEQAPSVALAKSELAVPTSLERVKDNSSREQEADLIAKSVTVLAGSAERASDTSSEKRLADMADKGSEGKSGSKLTMAQRLEMRQMDAALDAMTMAGEESEAVRENNDIKVPRKGAERPPPLSNAQGSSVPETVPKWRPPPGLVGGFGHIGDSRSETVAAPASGATQFPLSSGVPSSMDLRIRDDAGFCMPPPGLEIVVPCQQLQDEQDQPPPGLGALPPPPGLGIAASPAPDAGNLARQSRMNQGDRSRRRHPSTSSTSSSDGDRVQRKIDRAKRTLMKYDPEYKAQRVTAELGQQPVVHGYASNLSAGVQGYSLF